MNEAYIPGSYGGDPGKISDDTRLECKICWYVYDPARGDGYWQIPPGTPFSQFAERLGADTAGVARVTVIHLLGLLGAGGAHLLSIDDDDVVTAVHVRSERRLVLATQH